VSYATLTITVGVKALGLRYFLLDCDAHFDGRSAIAEFVGEAIRVKLLL
jgi:hypothetical protein